jgi:hypothetical protein
MGFTIATAEWVLSTHNHASVGTVLFVGDCVSMRSGTLTLQGGVHVQYVSRHAVLIHSSIGTVTQLKPQRLLRDLILTA